MKMKFDPRILTFSEATLEERIHYFSRFSESEIASTPMEEMKGWIIKGVEVFKTGTFRGKPYTESDLDEMVNNFRILKDAELFDPVFKKNHSESVEDSIGWIINVYREGDLLKGDLHLTDWLAYDKIRDKTWRYLSSEIYPPELAAEEFADSGISGHVLRGVAIVSIPKVKGLKGIVLNSEIIDEEGGNIVNREQVEALMKKLGLYSEEEIKAFSDEEIFTKFSEKVQEIKPAEPKPEAGGTPAPAGAQNFSENQTVTMSAADFTAMVQVAAGAEKKTVDLFSEIQALKNESKTQKVERQVAALVKAGKVTPAEKDGVLEFAENLEGEALDKYFKTFEKRVPVVEFGEAGGQQQGTEDDSDEAWKAFQEMRGNKTFE
jgi:hypothetical protein